MGDTLKHIFEIIILIGFFGGIFITIMNLIKLTILKDNNVIANANETNKTVNDYEVKEYTIIITNRDYGNIFEYKFQDEFSDKVFNDFNKVLNTKLKEIGIPYDSLRLYDYPYTGSLSNIKQYLFNFDIQFEFNDGTIVKDNLLLTDTLSYADLNRLVKYHKDKHTINHLRKYTKEKLKKYYEL